MKKTFAVSFLILMLLLNISVFSQIKDAEIPVTFLGDDNSWNWAGTSAKSLFASFKVKRIYITGNSSFSAKKIEDTKNKIVALTNSDNEFSGGLSLSVILPTYEAIILMEDDTIFLVSELSQSTTKDERRSIWKVVSSNKVGHIIVVENVPKKQK
jgi:hypothetical protein